VTSYIFWGKKKGRKRGRVRLPRPTNGKNRSQAVRSFLLGEGKKEEKERRKNRTKGSALFSSPLRKGESGKGGKGGRSGRGKKEKGGEWKGGERNRIHSSFEDRREGEVEKKGGEGEGLHGLHSLQKRKKEREKKEGKKRGEKPGLCYAISLY